MCSNDKKRPTILTSAPPPLRLKTIDAPGNNFRNSTRLINFKFALDHLHYGAGNSIVKL